MQHAVAKPFIRLAGPAILSTLSLLATACQPPRTQVKLQFEGQPVAACDAAEVMELHDGDQPGGIKLICRSPGWTLWIIHDTTDLKDKRIKQVMFSPPLDFPPEKARTLGLKPGQSDTLWLAAEYSSKLDKIDCASARSLHREGGEAPIPRRLGGGLEPGDYPIALARPCGKLQLTIQ